LGSPGLVVDGVVNITWARLVVTADEFGNAFDQRTRIFDRFARGLRSAGVGPGLSIAP
jgi:hypothetical protein